MTTEPSKAPLVKKRPVLVRGGPRRGQVRYWELLVQCPHCPMQHAHGSGNTTGDPDPGTASHGTRTPHCPAEVYRWQLPGEDGRRRTKQPLWTRPPGGLPDYEITEDVST
ncbi:hypothetical protein [Kitasatospora sp. NPDC101183]|uniref:hypothetical protein n=1 Tax=Kitasatospora sp. NPDC101183 TaxID=3364100 RepID=UPI0037F3E5E7